MTIVGTNAVTNVTAAADGFVRDATTPSVYESRTDVTSSFVGIGVSTKVGASELTRTPCGASSIAIALVSPSIACLEAQ